MQIINKVLFVSPHADDCELGCGMEMYSLAKRGCEVYHLVLSEGEKAGGKDERHLQAKQAAKILGVKHLSVRFVPNCAFFENRNTIFDTINSHIEEIQPHRIYLPSGVSFENDEDRDHIITSIEGVRAARYVQDVFFYECLKSYQFQGTYFSLHNDSILNKKLSAINCYTSQVSRGTLNIDEIIIRAKNNAILFNQHYLRAAKNQGKDLVAERFKIYRVAAFY